jgi:hypothetical protein
MMTRFKHSNLVAEGYVSLRKNGKPHTWYEERLNVETKLTAHSGAIQEYVSWVKVPDGRKFILITGYRNTGGNSMYEHTWDGLFYWFREFETKTVPVFRNREIDPVAFSELPEVLLPLARIQEHMIALYTHLYERLDNVTEENVVLFDYNEIAIWNPWMDETSRFEVDPIDYYGLNNIVRAVKENEDNAE